MSSNIKKLFEELNNNCNYIVLRNWDNVFDECIYGKGHEDIDVLCDDVNEFIKLTNAQRIHSNNHRDNYIVQLGDEKIRFDIRWVGDGYYPIKWEKTMLERRILSAPGVYVMCREDYCYSLAYHALIQKASLSDEYRLKIEKNLCLLTGKARSYSKNDICNELDTYLRAKSYKVVIPEDPGVYMNWAMASHFIHRFSIKLKIRRFIFRLHGRIGLKQY